MSNAAPATKHSAPDARGATLLEPRHEPYWHEVRRGLQLGYRKGTSAGSGAWIAREYINRKRPKRRIGLADDSVPADGRTVFSWSQALERALGAERPTLAPFRSLTVGDALEDYFQSRIARSPVASVESDRSRADTHINAALRARPIAELTTSELQKWLDDQVPPSAEREAQRRHQATAMRTWHLLAAILNHAYRTRRYEVPTADAWRAVTLFRKTDRPRTRFLSQAEAKRLLNALPLDFRTLARGSLYTGLRLGELLALRGADVHERKVHVQHSKGGSRRTVPLSDEGAAFFDEVTAGKTGSALLFTREDGSSWNKVAVSRWMKRACKRANVDPPASFHDLRRSYGSLLLNHGADATVIQELLGHADLRMTRRVYAHLLQSTVEKTVRSKLPSFGFRANNVRKFRQ